jgi:hypothetical protein
MIVAQVLQVTLTCLVTHQGNPRVIDSKNSTTPFLASITFSGDVLYDPFHPLPLFGMKQPASASALDLL